MNEVKIIDFLLSRGIPYRIVGKEVITKCFFSNCDNDSRGNEAHLYFEIDTGKYNCKKCDAKGNMVTLQKHFGKDPFDFSGINDIFLDFPSDTPKIEFVKVTQKLVEEYHKALPPRIIEYLNNRGISNEIISKYKIGYKHEYQSWWITIPIKDINGSYKFFKLRQDPELGKEKMTWPSGIEAQIYDWETLLMAKERVLIAEGEMDALLMKSKGIVCITNTHGARTAKETWMEHFNPELEYYIAYDNDEAGKEGAKNLAEKLLRNGCKNLHIINLPEEVGDGGDLGDYITRLNLPAEDLFSKYSRPFPYRIDTTQFKEISIEEVCKILDATIKKDDENKMITFLSMLTTYTDEAQMNVFFNAPSSTGKSHLPLSVADFFPPIDKIILAQCSPTAFFHEQGLYDKEKNEIIVDLSRKILIFTDMPNTGLLERLRSILSHDAKESRLKITDKNQKGGNRTKTVVIVGFPSVYFCSAGLRVDEQESTRFIMLSPSIEHEKIFQGIQQSISKESDREKFMKKLSDDPERCLLKERILGIKQEEIADVKIENTELIQKLFLQDSKSVKPRQQRDIKKIISLIKGFSLLNVWFRKRQDNYIWATENDIRDAFMLWNKISYGQDYGLAPYVFEIYTKIILPLWEEPSDRFGNLSSDTDRKHGISRKEILDRHFKIYGRPLSLVYLRQHILPQLEQVGLIMQERSMDDKREMVVIPLETKLEE
jgi:hypothetical protein